jgi:hypothetical protein
MKRSVKSSDGGRTENEASRAYRELEQTFPEKNRLAGEPIGNQFQRLKTNFIKRPAVIAPCMLNIQVRRRDKLHHAHGVAIILLYQCGVWTELAGKKSTQAWKTPRRRKRIRWKPTRIPAIINPRSQPMLIYPVTRLSTQELMRRHADSERCMSESGGGQNQNREQGILMNLFTAKYPVGLVKAILNMRRPPLVKLWHVRIVINRCFCHTLY